MFILLRFKNLLSGIVRSRVPFMTSRFNFDKEKLLKTFWGSLYYDYSTVGKEIIDNGCKKPYKAAIIISGLGLIYGAFKSNPDKLSFYDQLQLHANDLVLLNSSIRNQASENHIRYLNTCHNQGLIRNVNFLFFSVIWIDDYHSDCDIYAAECSYLKPEFIKFYKRIIDVGLYGQWLNMKWKMRNFDVNSEEWQI